jgi:hypothetical protein
MQNPTHCSSAVYKDAFSIYPVFPHQIAQLQEIAKSQNANQAMILTLEPSRRML